MNILGQLSRAATLILLVSSIQVALSFVPSSKQINSSRQLASSVYPPDNIPSSIIGDSKENEGDSTCDNPHDDDNCQRKQTTRNLKSLHLPRSTCTYSSSIEGCRQKDCIQLNSRNTLDPMSYWRLNHTMIVNDLLPV